MTNKLDPRHTGPATDPAADPTPTELLAWLRGREAVVDRRLEAHREGMLRALDARLEPVTKQLSELQLQVDATDRRLDQHIVANQPHSDRSYYTYTSGIERRLEGHIRSVDPHPHAREVTGEPDGVMTGPTGDGQSDLIMIKYATHLGNAHGTFARVAADPDVTREQFDVAVHEYREQVFEFTRQMRIIVASREGQGAQTADQ